MTTPTRSTRINRSSIAATLFGLLATIAGAQAQVPQCVCSPQKYRVSFDLAQDCATTTNEIAGLPGISGTDRSCNPSLATVTQVIIEEGNDTGSIKSTVVDYDPPVTSGTIEYTSISTELKADAPLEDQLEFVPLIIRVVLFGNNGNDETVLRDAVAVFYTNECESGPIDFQNSGLGNIRFTTVEAASVEWCRLPSSLPSASPAESPSGSYSISMSMMRYGGKGGKSVRVGKGGKNGERSYYSTSSMSYYYYGAAGKGGKKSGTSGSSSGYGYGGKGGKKRDEVI